MKTKRLVQEVLDRLPADCTLEDVQYHLYVVQAIERGTAEIANGKGIPHEEVARDLKRKWRRRAAR